VSAIILSRHGRPAWDYRTPIAGREFAGWRRGEENAPLDPASHPGSDLKKAMRTASFIITSALRRSIDSAHLLAPSTPFVTDGLFREADLPSSFHSKVRLRPNVWGMLARSAWFCGWSAGKESVAAARDRAVRAAEFLVDQAAAHGTVAVIGHGMMNWLIAHRLRSSGWHGPRIPSPRHWSFGVYRPRKD